MKSIKKLGFLVAIAILMCLSFVMVGLSTNTAKADTLNPTTFQMEEGTSAKLSDIAGLRFRVKLDTATKNKIVNEDNTTLTFVITPKVFITSVEDFKSVGQKITLTSDESKFYQEDNTSDIWYANCVITGIKEVYYKLDYSCVAYITDGETTVYTTNYTYNNIYATVNDSALDETYNYATKAFSLYTWFGKENYPVITTSQAQLDRLMEQKGEEDWTNLKVNAPEGVTAENITVQKAYIVTFKDYDGIILKKMSVKAGEKLSKLPMVVTSKLGKKISGYKDSNNVDFDINTAINSDLDLTAQLINSKEESIGLSYTLINNNTEYEVSGIGTCTDTEIIIPDTYNDLSVTSIGNGAFKSGLDKNITCIIIGNNVKSIGSYAFLSCTLLREVELPNSLESIGNGAFKQCSSLTSIDLPSGLNSIGGSAFSYSGLTTITIPNGVSSIIGETFKQSNLSSVQIGEGVTTIMANAFQTCDIKSIVVGNSLSDVKSNAFNGCESLTSVYYNGTQAGWGNITIEDGNNCLSTATKYYYSEEYVDGVVENTYWHYENNEPTVWEVHTHEFTEKNIDSKHLKSSATCTEKAVYYYSCSICGKNTIETFEYGEALNHSFTNYISDGNATCTANGTKTAKCDRCEVTDTIVVEDSKLPHTFNAQNANEKYLKSSATCTEKAVYYYSCSVCGEIDTNTFTYGTTLPHTFNAQNTNEKYLKSSATCTEKAVYYYSCSVCGEVGTDTFIYGDITDHNYVAGKCSMCDKIISLGLSYSLINSNTEYEVSGIGSCTDTKVIIQEKYNNLPITKIGDNAFSDNNTIESVVLGDNIKVIGNYAFQFCGALNSVIIGDGVISIGEGAFSCSSIIDVVIGSSVENIGKEAFSECYSLANIYYKGTKDNWNSIAIGEDNDNLTSATRYYYSENYPTNFAKNTYWHYVDNEPTVWERQYTRIDNEGNKSEIGNYILFGSYPQTHVSDTTLITALNNLTTTNSRGYYEYGGSEYAKITATPNQYGSYNDKYGNQSYYTYSDGSAIKNNTTEWFKVEPIKWRVLEEQDGSVKVVSTIILDNSCYYVNTYYRNIEGEDIAPNNYKYSTVREFLNDTFYNSAFTTAQQNAIITTEVDNSASTTGHSTNQYACENTFDKIYLLSYSEVTNSTYYADDSARQMKVTDYAKASGAYWNASSETGYWWLRSPYYYYVGSSRDVNYDGDPSNYFGVNYAGDGVVPALQISLG